MIGLPGGARSRQAQRLKKTLCRTTVLSHVILTRSQCHTAAAKGAKLSTILPRNLQGCAGAVSRATLDRR